MLGNTHEVMLWAWMLWVSYALGTRTLLCFGHGHRMLLEHERYYVFGMDAVATVCSWNTSVILFWAWMPWSLYAPGMRTLFCFEHGYSADRTLLKRERYQSYVPESIRLVLLKHEHSCMRNHRNVFNRMASYRRHFHKYDSISSLASAPLRAS